MKKYFDNLKIVELAGVLAGPSVGYFFSELGAKVIKIENPSTNGDVTRNWKLNSEDPSEKESAYYWSVNSGKEVKWLDLKIGSQHKSFLALIKDADVLICNFKKGDAKKLKADFRSLAKINPKLIWAGINGFGEDSERTAYDLILQAESGFMYMNGEKGSHPVKMPVALIDVLAAHQLKEAILIALLERNTSGKGAEIHVSLFQSAIASLMNQATNWLIADHLPQAAGSLHPNIAPYGELFETKDRQLITFAIGSNKQFESLCKIIDYPILAKDKQYATNQLRVKNRKQLYPILYNYINKISYKIIYKRSIDHNIPIGKIRNLKEVFEMPEAKTMLKTFKHEKKSKTVVSGIAFKINNG